MIFLVEDELEISQFIETQLKRIGKNDIASFTDGKEALNFLKDLNEKHHIELAIIDRMLPSINGLEICQFMRKNELTRATPILILTALSTPEQIIEGLDAGADDYMAKPFDHEILMARIRSLLRRNEFAKKISENKKLLVFKELVIDQDKCSVEIKGEALDLTLSEFKILTCLLLNPGKVLTRGQLVNYVQEGPIHVTDRTIDTHIFGLRKKLGDYASIVETIRGVGYRITGHE